MYKTKCLFFPTYFLVQERHKSRLKISSNKLYLVAAPSIRLPYFLSFAAKSYFYAFIYIRIGTQNACSLYTFLFAVTTSCQLNKVYNSNKISRASLSPKTHLLVSLLSFSSISRVKADITNKKQQQQLYLSI